MKCNSKTLLWLAAGALLAAGIAYVTIDGAHAAIAASFPFLLFLLCPLSMLFMMKAMHAPGSAQGQSSCAQQGLSNSTLPSSGPSPMSNADQGVTK